MREQTGISDMNDENENNYNYSEKVSSQLNFTILSDNNIVILVLSKEEYFILYIIGPCPI